MDHWHPFDIVDDTFAMEVKTMRSITTKIHIEDKAYKRKVQWAKRNKRIAILYAIILVDEKGEEYRVFRSQLTQHIRTYQMEEIT